MGKKKEKKGGRAAKTKGSDKSKSDFSELDRAVLLLQIRSVSSKIKRAEAKCLRCEESRYLFKARFAEQREEKELLVKKLEEAIREVVNSQNMYRDIIGKMVHKQNREIEDLRELTSDIESRIATTEVTMSEELDALRKKLDALSHFETEIERINSEIVKAARDFEKQYAEVQGKIDEEMLEAEFLVQGMKQQVFPMLMEQANEFREKVCKLLDPACVAVIKDSTRLEHCVKMINERIVSLGAENGKLKQGIAAFVQKQSRKSKQEEQLLEYCQAGASLSQLLHEKLSLLSRRVSLAKKFELKNKALEAEIGKVEVEMSKIRWKLGVTRVQLRNNEDKIAELEGRSSRQKSAYEDFVRVDARVQEFMTKEVLLPLEGNVFDEDYCMLQELSRHMSASIARLGEVETDGVEDAAAADVVSPNAEANKHRLVTYEFGMVGILNRYRSKRGPPATPAAGEGRNHVAVQTEGVIFGDPLAASILSECGLLSKFEIRPRAPGVY